MVRLIVGFFFSLILLGYYSAFVLLKSKSNDLALYIFAQLFVVYLAMAVPAFFSGIFSGQFLFSRDHRVLSRVSVTFITAFFVHFFYYYVAYFLLGVDNPGLITPAQHVGVIHPLSNVHDFIYYLIYQGALFSASVALFETLVVVMPGSFLVMAFARKFGRKEV